MRIPLSLSLSLPALCGGLLALGCDAGSVDGPNGPDEPAADAAVINPEIQCTTRYEVTGDVTHTVLPMEGASCNAAGTWTVTLGSPAAGAEREVCAEAPATASFTFTVTEGTPGGRDYTIVDEDDGSRVWEGRFADKSGSCTGSFETTLADGVVWSLHPGENGPDGALDGSARFEIVE